MIRTARLCLISVFVFALIPVAFGQLPWSSKELDEAKIHALTIDFGTEVKQGVRLGKTVRRGKPVYFFSLDIGGTESRRMPVTQKIFYERYHSFRNLFISAEVPGGSPIGCRLRVSLLRSTDGASATSDYRCTDSFQPDDAAKISEWHRETIEMILSSHYE